MYSLEQVPAGNSATVNRIHGKGALRKRLLDMGFTRKTEITVRKHAPLGDPIEVSVRGAEVTVRRADAAQIEVI
ncbi:MAG: FeoA family protein [Eubacteriaceae bacterium]|jgi:ferrous iron transport protein A